MAATLAKCLMLEKILEESDEGETDDDDKTSKCFIKFNICVNRYDKEIKILLEKTKTLHILNCRKFYNVYVRQTASVVEWLAYSPW